MHEFNLWYALIAIALVFGGLQAAAGLMIYLERKVSAYVQDRLGPNRVGPAGLLQSLADGLKFVLKEDVIPGHVDKVLFLAAPAVAMVTAMFAFAVVPFGAVEPEPVAPVPPGQTRSFRPMDPRDARGLLGQLPEAEQRAFEKKLEADQQAALAKASSAEQRRFSERWDRYRAELKSYHGSFQFVVAPNIDVGILFVFAVGSLAVYGIILGGWSANNKYSMLGGLRSSAQIISYEIPLGLSVLGVVLMSGSLNLERIVWEQARPDGDPAALPMWNVVYQPLAFLIFMVSAFAETNRLPFDLPEAEQELVGGYHTEYSAMKFAMFFLGEYCHMATTSFLMVILFFGGWHFPWVASAESHWVFKLIVFTAKMSLFVLWYMLIRWTLPRFRFDQLMALAWKVLIPLALVNLIAVMVVLEVKRVTGVEWLEWLLLPISLAVLVGAGFFASQPPPTGTQLKQRAQANPRQAVV